MDTTDGPGIPTRTIDTLVATWDTIADLCSDLSESQWKQPSELPGWSLQDVLAHVIGTEHLLAGEPAAEPGGERADHVRNPIGELNENEVAARRTRPGAAVLAEWNDLRARRARTLATADTGYFAQPMMTPTGPGTMADFLDVRILDCWVHEQDIRRVIGAPGNLAGPAAEHTVDRLTRTIPIVVGKRAACPEAGAVAVEITGGTERSLVYEVNGGRAALVDEPAADLLTTVTLDTEAFVVLATGRHTPAALGERVTVSGDTELGRRVVDNLNMMI